MADHSKQNRDNNDVLVSGGTRRQVRKAAKAKHPDERLKIRTRKVKLENKKEKVLANVPLRKRSKDGQGEQKQSKTGRKLLKRVIVTTKGKKRNSEPERYRNVRFL